MQQLNAPTKQPQNARVSGLEGRGRRPLGAHHVQMRLAGGTRRSVWF